jgi:murein DD-endopeptidase MepM/ murein hydrolase activator NlpD
VLKTGEDDDYGNFILLQHEGGLQTFYAHCSELLAEEGMVIRAGEIIALVGSTGLSTGPHLHFELRLNGVRCNPEPLLAGVYGSLEAG